MQFRSKLPDVGTTIFAVMSALAREHQAINLSQGFPDFDCPEELKKLVTKHIQDGHNQYAPMPGLPGLREVLADKIRKLYGYPADPDYHITITAGATQGLYSAIGALTHVGDEVIIFDPAYDCYGPAVRSFGGTPVPVALHAPDFRIDWRQVEEKITPASRMIVINTPHNPLGRVLHEEDMQQLSRIANSHDLFVLSDEVYEHITFDGMPHLSVLRYPALRDRAIAVFSFGKVFHATGWKVGYAVASERLTTEFRKNHQFNTYAVNTPMQYAIADYMQDPATYLGLPAFFQEKRDKFAALMEETGFEMLPCEGSYFILADYSALSDLDDLAFARWLTTDHGVATIPLSPFYSEAPAQHVVRFCFAKTNEVLEEAVERLVAVPVQIG
jgi:methionine aminotransferase